MPTAKKQPSTKTMKRISAAADFVTEGLTGIHQTVMPLKAFILSMPECAERTIALQKLNECRFWMIEKLTNQTVDGLFGKPEKRKSKKTKK